MAITYDTSSSGNASPGNATVTISHTITGSNTILIIGVTNQNAGGLSVGTYNGTSFLSNVLATITSGGVPTTLYYIYAAAGTANIVVTRNTTTNYLMVMAASYTGVNQSMVWSGGGATDATNTGSGTASTFTGTVTSIADNSWAILTCEFDNASLSAGTGSTLRQSQIPGYVAWGIFDTNGAKTPAGSISMGINGASGGYRYAIATISPAVSSTTQIKSRNGILIANVKSADGVTN